MIILEDNIAEKIQSLLSDEESMQQIKELASMFSGGAGETALSLPEGNPDGGGDEKNPLPINPAALMQLVGALSASDKNCDLLNALRPHLRAERRQKLDRAVKLLKLYNIFLTMRENGLLNDLDKML